MTKKAIQGKLNDRGTVGLFVGYPDNHADDVYRIFNIKTKQIIKSRDLVWLNLSYGNWKSKNNNQQPPDDDDTSDTEAMEKDASDLAEAEDATLDEAQIRKQNKALKQISKLKSWFNPDPSKFLEMQNSGREMIVETADFAFNMVDLVKDPESFEEAYHHPEAGKKIMWRRAISKEFEDMEAKGVWEKFQKSEIPNGRNCIKNKWVFKTKRNGIFRARLVACGYSQIPGVDFQESYAPVINDVTFRILLVTMLTWNLIGKVIDIETAFLHGDLKETIFMEIPKGMEANKDECLILKRTIYGLVQSAREFYNKLVLSLKGCGFMGIPVDPCLWIKHSEFGIVMVAVYVDDCLVVGSEEGIQDMINCLKNCDFGLKIEDNLTDYLSCKIQINQATKTTYIMQPHLIKSLIDKFGEEVEDLCNYGTPGTPRFKIVRPDDADKEDAAMQSRYRSGVGMLLYLIKYLRPDLANVVRELSKCMDGASLAAYKEMQRVIKFVLDTRMHCLKL